VESDSNVMYVEKANTKQKTGNSIEHRNILPDN